MGHYRIVGVSTARMFGRATRNSPFEERNSHELLREYGSAWLGLYAVAPLAGRPDEDREIAGIIGMVRRSNAPRVKR